MKKILIPIFAFFITSISTFSQTQKHPEEDIPMAKVPVGIVPGSADAAVESKNGTNIWQVF